MQTLYTAEALSSGGGRDGHVRTSDGALDADMTMPKEMGGAGRGVNPEQLFAAGYAACFHSALQSIARSQKVAIDGSSVGAKVSLVKPEDQGFEGIGLAVHLEVAVPGLPRAEAQQLADAAHQGCPYSKATRGNIEVTVDVVDD